MESASGMISVPGGLSLQVLMVLMVMEVNLWSCISLCGDDWN